MRLQLHNAIGVALLFLLFQFPSRTVAEPQDYKLGAIGSLSGPAAPFSRGVYDGFAAYVKTWNSQGGYRGRPIAIDVQDDETNGINAIGLLKRLAGDPSINAIAFFGGSQTALAIKTMADEFRVPILGTGTVDALAKPPASYFFRALAGTSDRMQNMFEWLKQHGFSTLAILTSGDAVGQSEASLIRRLAPEYGLKIVADETFATTDTNFNAQLIRIRASNPSFFYAAALGAPAPLAFKQIKQLGLKMPLMMHEAAFSPAFFNAVGGREAAEGAYSLVDLGTLANEATGKSGEQYNNAQKALGRDPTQFEAVGWDMGHVLANAIVSSDGTREGIRQSLEDTRDLAVIGGFFSFSAEEHGGKDKRGVAMAQLVGGKFVRAK